MRLALLLFILCTFVACNSSVKDTDETEVNETEAVGTGKASDVLIENQTTHVFSDTAAPDTFKITLRGDSLLTSKATLEIISSNGEVLYKNEFAADFLFDYNLQANATAQEKEEFIRDRVKNFFNAENFIKPAIKPEHRLDPNYSNKAVWDEIKADTSAVGFHYQLGKEDGRWLAYSKKQNKVVLYLNCC